MATIQLITFIASLAGPVLGAWAHYRLNQAKSSPAPAPSAPSAPASPPHIGDGHIINAIANGVANILLGGGQLPQPAQPAPAEPVTLPSLDQLSQLVSIFEKVLSIVPAQSGAQASVPQSPAK